MSDVFVSHVEEDSAAALQVAAGLERAGYSTWTYERDSVPGQSYLVQTAAAVERSRAVVLLVSSDSLGSQQVTVEVVRGHETGKPFVPVLLDVTEGELATRQPEWREAVGGSTLVSVRRGRSDEVAPRVGRALRTIGVEPSGVVTGHLGPALPVTAGQRWRSRLGGSRRWQLLVAVAAVVVIGVAVLVVMLSGPSPPDPGGPGATGPSAPTSQPQATAEAATTPLHTVMGDAKVGHARLIRTMCPPAGLGACKTAASGRYLLLTMEGVGGGALQMTIEYSQEEASSYVLHEGRRYYHLPIGYMSNGVITAVYGGLPESAAGDAVTLVWPHNPHLRIAVMGE